MANFSSKFSPFADIPLCLILVVAGCGGNDEWMLAPGTPPVADREVAHELVWSHFIGEGILEDSRGALAASNKGLLAVSETSKCSVSVFDIVTGDLRFQVGSCGSGPEEMQRISTLAFTGDTLWVVEPALRRVSLFDENGLMLDRFSMSRLWGSLLLSEPSLVFAGSDVVASHPVRSAPGPMVSIVNRHDRELVASVLPDVRAVRKSNPPMFSMGVGICGAQWSAGPVIVAHGTWQFETVALNALNGEVVWRSVSHLDWLNQYVYEGSRLPTGTSMRPICGTNGVLVRMSRTLPSSPVNSSPELGYFEIRDVSGKLLLGKEMASEDEYILYPGASWEEYWAFLDPQSDKPRVRVVRLVATAN